MKPISGELGYKMMLLSDDGAGKVEIVKGEEVIMTDILSLLMTGPGQYPSIPELNYDINDIIRMNHNEADTKLEEVKQQIMNIITTLYPEATVDIEFNRTTDDKGISSVNTTVYINRDNVLETKKYSISMYDRTNIK